MDGGYYVFPSPGVQYVLFPVVQNLKWI